MLHKNTRFYIYREMEKLLRTKRHSYGYCSLLQRIWLDSKEKKMNSANRVPWFIGELVELYEYKPAKNFLGSRFWWRSTNWKTRLRIVKEILKHEADIASFRNPVHRKSLRMLDKYFREHPEEARALAKKHGLTIKKKR